jgi:putative ABC transport system ATP-binding protein
MTARTITDIAARMADGVKTYGEGDAAVHALNGATAEFGAGRFTAIMGPSGSGKSTMLHCLAGLDTLTSGAAYIGDVDLATLKDKDLTLLRRKRVGFIFQAFNLVPTLDAQENIVLPLTIAGTKPDQDWYDQIIEILGIGDRLDHLPAELSGGQQQRVAAARALVSKPEIIFADEPSGNLDSKSGAELLAFMRRAVKEFGQTIVMVTHDPNTAAYADRVIFLEDGVFVHEMHDPTPDLILDSLKKMGS